MENPSEIEFQVDEQYENEKGVFTVVSMERGEMVIRWENGEEIRTDIELQRRIIQRRQREAAQRAQAAADAAKPSGRKGKAPFDGLHEGDFKTSASGTRWRSRQQLGGAVVRQMGTSGLKFNSWAVGNQSEMHIQDGEHRKQGTLESQAKFFVRLDKQFLQYGFRVSRQAAARGHVKDWKAVSEWLDIPENDTMLRSLVLEEHLQVATYTDARIDMLIAVEKGWHKEGDPAKAEKIVSSLQDLVAPASDADLCELEIAAVVAKDDALAEGADVATKIAQLFTRLLPLYRAAFSR